MRDWRSGGLVGLCDHDGFETLRGTDRGGLMFEDLKGPKGRRMGYFILHLASRPANL